MPSTAGRPSGYWPCSRSTHMSSKRGGKTARLAGSEKSAHQWWRCGRLKANRGELPCRFSGVIGMRSSSCTKVLKHWYVVWLCCGLAECAWVIRRRIPRSDTCALIQLFIPVGSKNLDRTCSIPKRGKMELQLTSISTRDDNTQGKNEGRDWYNL